MAELEKFDILEARRKAVCDYFLAMAHVEWTPAEDIDLTDIIKNLIYKKGVKYTGLPYRTDVKFKATEKYEPPYAIATALNKEQFEVFLDKDRVYRGPTERYKFYGNNCTSAVYAAWAIVADSITFTYSANMMPGCHKGILPLGDYKWDDSMDTTPKIFEVNTPEKMYECYALLKPADAVLHVYGVAGHARVIEKNEVVYDANGNIDPENSKITCLEQTCSWDKVDVNTTWYLHHQYNYKTLVEKTFIPITIKELQEV